MIRNQAIPYVGHAVARLLFVVENHSNLCAKILFVAWVWGGEVFLLFFYFFFEWVTFVSKIDRLSPRRGACKCLRSFRSHYLIFWNSFSSKLRKLLSSKVLLPRRNSISLNLSKRSCVRLRVKCCKFTDFNMYSTWVHAAPHWTLSSEEEKHSVQQVYSGLHVFKIQLDF
jgi:hypothetical protein